MRLTFGEETFDVVNVMASEVAKIGMWTGYASKSEWLRAVGAEEIKAWQAAYTLMKQRAGEQVTFEQVDFDTDTLDSDWIDPPTGRSISPMLMKDPNGEVAKDHHGDPIPLKDGKGNVQWEYDDDGTVVPTEGDQSTSTGRPSSGSSSASEPGPPRISAA